MVKCQKLNLNCKRFKKIKKGVDIKKKKCYINQAFEENARKLNNMTCFIAIIYF